MAYTLHDHNGNLYTDLSATRATLYGSLKCASEALAKLPQGYQIKDTQTKKKVEPL